MSKRPNEEPIESREERWLRKLQFYQDKLETKRRRRAENQTPASAEQDVQSEDHLESNANEEIISLIPVEPPEDAQTVIYEENFETFTETTTTTAPSSPGSSPREDPETGDFDPNLLRELGDPDKDPVEYGEDLQEEIASRYQKILIEGLKKEVKEELLKKYPFPKNVPLSKGPTLNPEISAMLVDTCRSRDKRLLVKQDQLGKALSALGKGLSGLLKKTPDIPEIVRTLNDAGKLLADSHYTETDTRRSVIIPLIDKSLADPFKDRKRDSFLFGEKLSDLVKDSRGIKKTGQLLQPTASTSSSLNFRGPSSRAARQQRGGSNSFPYRAGGPRTTTLAAAAAYQYSNRRRAPPPPPHLPPPRRQPQGPPPSHARPPPPPAQRRPNRS